MTKKEVEMMIEHEVQLSLDQAHQRICAGLTNAGLLMNQGCGLTEEIDLVYTEMMDFNYSKKVFAYYYKFCERIIARKALEANE
jgi:hypothetical protein